LNVYMACLQIGHMTYVFLDVLREGKVWEER
jgi:hypothetical protein